MTYITSIKQPLYKVIPIKGNVEGIDCRWIVLSNRLKLIEYTENNGIKWKDISGDIEPIVDVCNDDEMLNYWILMGTSIKKYSGQLNGQLNGELNGQLIGQLNGQLNAELNAELIGFNWCKLESLNDNLVGITKSHVPTNTQLLNIPTNSINQIPINSLKLIKSRDSLLSISNKGIVKIHSNATYSPLLPFITQNGHFTSVDVNPINSNSCITGNNRGLIQIWDIRMTCSPVNSISPHSFIINKLVYHPLHDRLVLSASGDGTISLLDIHSGSSHSSHSSNDEILNTWNDIHVDSVYDVDWSYPLDSDGPGWDWLSVGWDGRCCLNGVEEKVRMEILGL